MTFRDAEAYLLSLCNMPRQEYMKDPRKCGVYLERTKYLLELLGAPEKKIPHYIHITGTSGKGSVACLMESIIRASGKKTGMLTSPHASNITERWQVNGKQMSDTAFVRIVQKLKPILDQYIRTTPYDMVSFHEITDAIGFYYFAEQHVDWGILEVGMGGAYCSSNVIAKKDVAIITNIGWDHKRLIGPTKAKITEEKAGIITGPCQVFTMEKSKRLLDIMKKQCKKKKATLHEVSSFKFQVSNSNTEGSAFQYKNQDYKLSTLGDHQIKNAILCIEIAETLSISDSAIKKGLRTAKLPLRMEIASQAPLIIVDGAHNKEKMQTTVESLKQLHKKRIHLLIGFSGDKEWKQMVDQLSTLKPTSVACTRNTMNIFRKVANPQKIADRMKNQGIKKTAVFLNPGDALSWSKTQMSKNDILLVTGSVFLSGEIRGLLTK